MNIQERVILTKKEIKNVAVKYGLNLTIYDGKIGFVDQEEKKIVALWSPEFKLQDNGARLFDLHREAEDKADE